MRKTFQGFPDPNSPEIRQEIEKYLALSIQTVHQAEEMFTGIRPDVVFVMEANYAFFGIIVDVALEFVFFCHRDCRWWPALLEGR